MNAYELFENLKESHKKYNVKKGLFFEDNQDFIRNASLLARLNEENPYDNNTPENSCYFDFIYFYEKWPKYKADCALHKMFLMKAEELCEYDNLFFKPDGYEYKGLFENMKSDVEKDEEELKQEEIEVEQFQDEHIEEIENIEPEESFVKTESKPQVVLGVVPNNKKYNKNRRHR